MSIKLFGVLSIVLGYVYSCHHSNSITTPQAVIERYQRLVLEMKSDSISELFTTDAEIGHGEQPAIKGRDSIYALLRSFKNVRVIQNRDDISSTSERGDSATVNGNYKQTVIVSEKDTVHVAGTFTAEMIRDKNKNWLIRKMRTKSL
jgi:SnoaL-like protein